MTSTRSRKSHSIQVLDHIGTKRRQLLERVGVRTVGDFLAAEDGSLGLTPAMHQKIKASAQVYVGVRDKSNTPNTTDALAIITNHSWYNKSLHLVRKDGSIVRAKVQELRVESQRVIMLLEWYEAEKLKRKAQSPLLLASLHILWCQNMIMPEDTDEETPLHLVAPSVDYILPILSVETSETFPALTQVIREVTLLQNALSYCRHDLREHVSPNLSNVSQ